MIFEQPQNDISDTFVRCNSVHSRVTLFEFNTDLCCCSIERTTDYTNRISVRFASVICGEFVFFFRHRSHTISLSALHDWQNSEFNEFGSVSRHSEYTYFCLCHFLLLPSICYPPHCPFNFLRLSRCFCSVSFSGLLSQNEAK